MYVYECPDAVIAGDNTQYPIVIFSPGYRGDYGSNSTHCQELASHGYVVVGMSHPYDSKFIQFPDGRTKTGIEILQHKSFTERRTLIDQQFIEDRVADVQFVLDQLQRLAKNEQSTFYQRLDLEHIGMFGQSLGGSTAVVMCRRDTRIKAGVDLDGSLFGTDATQTFDKPFMFITVGETAKIFDRPMTKDEWKTFHISSWQEEQMVRDRYLRGFATISAGKQDMYTFVINGAGHLDLTDEALLIKYAVPIVSQPIIKMMLVGPLGLGPIDGMRVTEIVNKYLIAFFDKYLKDADISDAILCNLYPEDVIVKKCGEQKDEQ